jgi:predicted Zn-ribbon and HTH transcriptional regulator
MSAPLTKKQVREYLKNPNRCPYCGSYQINSDKLDADGFNTATANVDCDKCKNQWVDIYEIVNVNAAEEDV